MRSIARDAETKRSRIGSRRAESSTVAASLNNSGLVYFSLGKYEEALSRFVEANQIMAETLGAHHPNVGLTVRIICNIYFQLGKLDQAEPSFQVAIDIESNGHSPRSCTSPGFWCQSPFLKRSVSVSVVISLPCPDHSPQ